jgi:sortase A
LKTYQARRYRRQQKRMYRRYRRRRAGAKIVSVVATILVIAGLGLVAHSLILGQDSLVQRAVTTATESEEVAASAPKETTLWLTVPKMARVEDLPIYDAAWDSEAALDASAAHLDSSGFPWEDEANVYITGHRMGFPGSRSFLVFYDLDVLQSGDEVFLTDSEGTRYTYTVFDQFVSDPFDWSPTEPVPGENIVTLQTCTLPDYTQRLMVQAELTETTQGAESPREDTAPEDAPQEVEVAPEDIPPEDEIAPEFIPEEEFAPEILPEEEIAPEVIPEGEGLPEPVPQEEIVPEAIPPEPIPPEPIPPEAAPPLQAAPPPEAIPPQDVPPQPIPPGPV